MAVSFRPSALPPPPGIRVLCLPTPDPRIPTHGAPQHGLMRRRAHRISVIGVSALAVGSPELACISLHGTTLADGAVRALCDACPKLRHINLSVTRVTERSLRLLAMKDSLRCVFVEPALTALFGWVHEQAHGISGLVFSF